MPAHVDKEESVLTYISSEHASSKSQDGSQFIVNMNNTVYAEKASAISVNQVVVPNVFPNVNAYRNEMRVAGNLITIPVGQYTASTLATTVTALIAAIPLNVTLTYTADAFVWTNNEAGLQTISASSEVWEMLGWDWRNFTLFAGLYTIDVAGGGGTNTAPHLPSLYGEKLVHIVCDRLGHGNCVHGADGKLHDVIATVPLADTQWGFTKVWEPHEVKQWRVNFKYVNSISSSLEFQLLDTKMRALPMPYNHHIQMVVKVYHKEHTG